VVRTGALHELPGHHGLGGELTTQAITAASALLLAGAILWLGRRDLTRPAVAFGVPWFGFIALAQLGLTDLERPWSIGFTRVAFGGGLAFVVAAVLAGGTAGARGTVRVDRERVNARRLTTVAVALILAGIPAVIYRAHVIGGVPLLSANPDIVRTRVFQGGEGVLPAWSSALTGGFYIGLWAALAAIWALAPRVTRWRLVPLWLLALLALFGVALEASRNLVIFAVVVAALGAYLISAPGHSRAASLGWVAGAVCVLVLGVGGLFALRLTRGDTNARDYISQQGDDLPAPVRPLLPLYVSAVYPFEAARRTYDAVPSEFHYEYGGASLTSLPHRLFPKGKPKFGPHMARLMSSSSQAPARVTWTVSGYQGRLLSDLGWPGVMLGSMLLGLLFGGLYRWARGKAGLLPVALVAYLGYYAAYMVYDNQLSFSVIAIYDLSVIALISTYCLGRTGDGVASLRRLGRRLAARQSPAEI